MKKLINKTCGKSCPVVSDLRKELEDARAKLAKASMIISEKEHIIAVHCKALACEQQERSSLKNQLRRANRLKSVAEEMLGHVTRQHDESLVLISKLQSHLNVFQASRLGNSGPKISGGP